MAEDDIKPQPDMTGYWSSRLDRLEEKLDRVAEGQTVMNLTLAAQHGSLDEHMRRTAILEAAVKPLTLHVAVVTGLAKVLAVAGTIVGILTGVLKLLGK